MPRPAPTRPAEPDALVERLLPLVGGWCARLGGPGLDAEAATHEVLLVALRRQGDLRPGAEIEPWAWGITVRVIRAQRRRAWLRRWLPGAVPDRASDEGPHEALESRRTARMVWRVLDALTEAHREVLVLCDVEERGRAEVAAILGIPEGTVKSRLRLARAAFRAESERLGLPFVQLLGGEDA